MNIVFKYPPGSRGDSSLNGYVHNLTQEQQVALRTVQQWIVDNSINLKMLCTYYHHPVFPLLAYLRNNNFDIDTTISKLLEDFQKRRLTNPLCINIGKLPPEKILNADSMSDFAKIFPSWHCGFDFNGSPIIYKCFQKFFINDILRVMGNSLNLTPLVNYHIWEQEVGAKLCSLQTNKLNFVVESIILVYDLKGVTLLQLKNDIGVYISEIFKIYSPGFIGDLYFINVPIGFTPIFKVFIAPYVEKHMLSRIHALGSPAVWFPVLDKIIGKENMPENYGGTLGILDEYTPPFAEFLYKVEAEPTSVYQTEQANERAYVRDVDKLEPLKVRKELEKGEEEVESNEPIDVFPVTPVVEKAVSPLFEVENADKSFLQMFWEPVVKFATPLLGVMGNIEEVNSEIVEDDDIELKEVAKEELAENLSHIPSEVLSVSDDSVNSYSPDGNIVIREVANGFNKQRVSSEAEKKFGLPKSNLLSQFNESVQTNATPSFVPVTSVNSKIPEAPLLRRNSKLDHSIGDSWVSELKFLKEFRDTNSLRMSPLTGSGIRRIGKNLENSKVFNFNRDDESVASSVISRKDSEYLDSKNPLSSFESGLNDEMDEFKNNNFCCCSLRYFPLSFFKYLANRYTLSQLRHSLMYVIRAYMGFSVILMILSIYYGTTGKQDALYQAWTAIIALLLSIFVLGLNFVGYMGVRYKNRSLLVMYIGSLVFSTFLFLIISLISGLYLAHVAGLRSSINKEVSNSQGSLIQKYNIMLLITSCIGCCFGLIPIALCSSVIYKIQLERYRQHRQFFNVIMLPAELRVVLKVTQTISLCFAVVMVIYGAYTLHSLIVSGVSFALFAVYGLLYGGVFLVISSLYATWVSTVRQKQIILVYYVGIVPLVMAVLLFVSFVAFAYLQNVSFLLHEDGIESENVKSNVVTALLVTGILSLTAGLFQVSSFFSARFLYISIDTQEETYLEDNVYLEWVGADKRNAPLLPLTQPQHYAYSMYQYLLSVFSWSASYNPVRKNAEAVLSSNWNTEYYITWSDSVRDRTQRLITVWGCVMGFTEIIFNGSYVIFAESLHKDLGWLSSGYNVLGKVNEMYDNPQSYDLFYAGFLSIIVGPLLIFYGWSTFVRAPFRHLCGIICCTLQIFTQLAVFFTSLLGGFSNISINYPTLCILYFIGLYGLEVLIPAILLYYEVDQITIACATSDTLAYNRWASESDGVKGSGKFGIDEISSKQNDFNKWYGVDAREVEKSKYLTLLKDGPSSVGHLSVYSQRANTSVAGSIPDNTELSFKDSGSRSRIYSFDSGIDLESGYAKKTLGSPKKINGSSFSDKDKVTDPVRSRKNVRFAV